MKKRLIIVVNVVIVLSVLGFVLLYTNNEMRKNIAAQTEDFAGMTVAMERVTANYLEGEQRVCDSWANYINSHQLTMEQAIGFVGCSLTRTENMGQILTRDESGALTGLSTAPKTNAPEDYTVSYANVNVLGEWDAGGVDPGRDLNITRAYTNPVNGVRSIAFCDRVTLHEAEGPVQALLLRIVPLSYLEGEWTFPTENYARAEISIIESSGDYIIRSRSMKNSNFFEFYKSYNETDSASLEALKREFLEETGTREMLNSRGQKCVIAHVPVGASLNWTIVTYIPQEDLFLTRMDWVLISCVSAGLLLLLAIDLIIMRHYNRKLIASAAEAASASRAKTDFLSTMSHDIRTPMNAIIGLTAIAGKNVQDTDLVRDSLKKINLAGNHLLTLINDILDISKVESGKLTLNPGTFSLVDTAENLVNLSQPMVKEKNIDFDFRVSSMEHEHLFADQLRVNQIFINLLSNAIKYTEPGGRVSIDLRQEPGRDDKNVRLIYTVSDTGIGMTPEFMQKMYQPFSRQTDSRVNTIQGTGLGLAITRQMVELMQGDIQCQSAPGEGTTFTVTLELPIAERVLDDLALPPMDVLLADDDPVLLETGRETLQAIGLRPDTAASGAEALARVRERHAAGRDYRAVILDWKMPDMGGVEVARRVRAEVGEEVSILIISAYDWSDIEEEARAAGVNGFVSKPLFRSTLSSKLNELMGNGAQAHDPEEDDSDIAGMHILIAEDNDVNWEIISMLLSMHGITCERAENGQVALERVMQAAEGEFDLIFMDIQMPVMNGLDATRAIRALKDAHRARIPIVAMTADAFSENVSECLEAGMNGHIAKPIDMKLVLKEIRRIKEGHL